MPYFTVVYKANDQEAIKELLMNDNVAAARWGHAIDEVGTEPTLRDKFAMQAMSALITDPREEYVRTYAHVIARCAYAIADAMLKEKANGCRKIS